MSLKGPFSFKLPHWLSSNLPGFSCLYPRAVILDSWPSSQLLHGCVIFQRGLSCFPSQHLIQFYQPCYLSSRVWDCPDVGDCPVNLYLFIWLVDFVVACFSFCRFSSKLVCLADHLRLPCHLLPRGCHSGVLGGGIDSSCSLPWNPIILSVTYTSFSWDHTPILLWVCCVVMQEHPL